MSDFDSSDEQQMQEWYDRKTALMEEVLGPEYPMVMHALVPYAIGGGLDLFYYTERLPGTAVATKELSELPGQGSSNDVFRCYEFVMFTRQNLDLDSALDEHTPFGRMHQRLNAILNLLAPYSAEARINPYDTGAIPEDCPEVGGAALIFVAYPSIPEEEPAEFGLMAIIEILPSELEYAREKGGAQLIERLKAAGHYPYSDLDRDPVV